MIDQQKLQQLGIMLKRIFALPVTRITFREIQSAYMAFFQADKDFLTDALDSLLVGQVKPSLNDKLDSDEYQKIIQEFCIQTRVAKEVHDKGPFISFISSDVLNQPAGVVLSNCVKTIEGEELRFATDIESSVQLITHFVGRLIEAKKVESSQADFVRLQAHLENVRSALAQL